MHQGLGDETLREVICSGLLKAHFDRYPEQPRRPFPNGSKAIALYRIENYREKIKEIEFNLDKDVRLIGYLTLMEDMGWDGFDVSEYIPMSGEHHRDFIGTEEEYEELIIKLKK